MVEYLKMTFVQLSGPHLKSHCYGVIRMGWDRIMPKTLRFWVKGWSFYLTGLALAFFSTTFSSSEALRFLESFFSMGLDLVCR